MQPSSPPPRKETSVYVISDAVDIALLEVVGKVVARVIQARLQKLAEEELPESQCGFREGRGCSDMIFTIHQLVEKSIEHQSKQFIIFVDLKNAYDTVQRAALWCTLKKLGVPDLIIDTMWSLHEGMKVQVRVNGEMSKKINVENGLRQGCTLTPVLFNLYACLVVERWISWVSEVDGAGTYLRFKFDQRLFRRSTRNAQESQITDGQFADDGALLATSRAGAEHILWEYMDVAGAFGLLVSLVKTKLMVAGRAVREEERTPIPVGDAEIESVAKFTYLGSLIDNNGRMDAEVNRRIASASKAFGDLRSAVFKDRHLYGSECWTLLRKNHKRLNAFHHRCIHTILGITSQQQQELHITSEMTRELWGDLETTTAKVTKRRLEWLGHVARMPNQHIPKMALFGWLPEPRPPGGPRKRWRNQIRQDLRAVGVSEEDWYEEASHRAGWRAIYRQGLRDQYSQQEVPTQPQNQVHCQECGRSFRREGDRARHKCIAERQRPVCEQSGAV